jgi:prepilin-type N-terminal cleavage/methylation domain-containing protein
VHEKVVLWGNPSGKKTISWKGVFILMMRKKLKKILSCKGGFSLIELIIVIGIMGFLVAMIAPRLAGVMAGSVEHISDNNQLRLQQALGTFTERSNALPDGGINLVLEAADPTVVGLELIGSYYSAGGANAAWMFDNNNKRDGAEIFSDEIADGAQVRIHILDVDEADELIKMGIREIYNLNLSQNVSEYNDVVMNWNADVPANVNPFMAKVEVAEGVGVLMYGAGHDGTAWDVIAGGEKIAQPELLYRIILGVGPESALISEGLISKAGMCPGGLQRSGHFAYNNYSMVLPRLSATTELGGILTDATFIDGPTGQVKEFTFEAQDVWQVTTICPEGHVVLGAGGGEWVLQ